jgi:hypothetical protein
VPEDVSRVIDAAVIGAAATPREQEVPQVDDLLPADGAVYVLDAYEAPESARPFAEPSVPRGDPSSDEEVAWRVEFPAYEAPEPASMHIEPPADEAPEPATYVESPVYEVLDREPWAESVDIGNEAMAAPDVYWWDEEVA